MENESTTEFRPLILVAEDDDSNFKLIKAIIGKKCDILWAKNGEEIVNLFRENRCQHQKQRKMKSIYTKLYLVRWASSFCCTST